LGDIGPEELGITDCHEHLIRSGGPEIAESQDYLLNDVDKAVQEFNLFVQSGGKAVVAMDPIGCGRDVGAMLEVARRVSGHILLTTGFHRGELYDNRHHWVMTCSVDQIARMLIAEIQEGLDVHSYNGPIVERVPARAGLIKAGTSYLKVTEFERRALQAAALAQNATGAPIVTHTSGGTMALEQVSTLKEHGADVSKIVVGHMHRNPDPAYNKRVLDTGVNLGYDTCRFKYYSENFVVSLLLDLVRAGYQKQIVLGHDAGTRGYQKAWGAGVGLDYLLTEFVPRLRSEGMPEDAIDDILVNTPARIFAIETKSSIGASGTVPPF
jgi:phosphotriesterase-related protein